jgi:TolA-binding protein
VDALQARVDALTARVAHPADAAAGARGEPSPARVEAAEPRAELVPPDLAVVKIKPARPSSPRPAAGRVAPPVPTAVPLVEPGPEALEALGHPGRRGLAADAAAALQVARAKPDGLARAHALEDFAAHYPHHTQADNALVEAAAAYEADGKGEAACTLARRVEAEYPAGDAIGDALERLARCEATRGHPDAERRLLERLAREHPGTPAAERAGARLATISGHADATSAAGPARSSP